MWNANSNGHNDISTQFELDRLCWIYTFFLQNHLFFHIYIVNHQFNYNSWTELAEKTMHNKVTQNPVKNHWTTFQTLEKYLHSSLQADYELAMHADYFHALTMQIINGIFVSIWTIDRKINYTEEKEKEHFWMDIGHCLNSVDIEKRLKS